jgi:hypothetical protein
MCTKRKKRLKDNFQSGIFLYVNISPLYIPLREAYGNDKFYKLGLVGTSPISSLFNRSVVAMAVAAMVPSVCLYP